MKILKIYEDFISSLIKPDAEQERLLEEMSIAELWESGKDIGQISYIKKLEPSYPIIKQDLDELIGADKLEQHKQFMKSKYYGVEPKPMIFNTYSNGPLIKSVVVQDIYLPGANIGGASIADKILFDDIVLKGWNILAQEHRPKSTIVLEYDRCLLQKGNSIIEASVTDKDKVFGTIRTVVKV